MNWETLNDIMERLWPEVKNKETVFDKIAKGNEPLGEVIKFKKYN